MSQLRTALAGLALCTLMTVPGAHATTVLQVSVPEMTTTSQWVVRAQVLETEVVDLRGHGGGLVTDVELLITDVYAGSNVPEVYTLRLMGGRGADGMTLKIPGMPGFVPGEDVVLFLEETSMGHIPCGLGQGVWRVLNTPSGEWVRQSMGGAHMMRRGATGHLVEASPLLMNPVRALDDLIDEVVAAEFLGAPLQATPLLATPPKPLTVKP